MVGCPVRVVLPGDRVFGLVGWFTMEGEGSDRVGGCGADEGYAEWLGRGAFWGDDDPFGCGSDSLIKTGLAQHCTSGLRSALLYGLGSLRGLGRKFFWIMSVKIRLKRTGAKNSPVYRIVVADNRSPRDGKFIEELGTYQPRQKGTNYTLDLERAKYWISVGALPSDTVASFIKKAGRAAVAAA